MAKKNTTDEYRQPMPEEQDVQPDEQDAQPEEQDAQPEEQDVQPEGAEQEQIHTFQEEYAGQEEQPAEPAPGKMSLRQRLAAKRSGREEKISVEGQDLRTVKLSKLTRKQKKQLRQLPEKVLREDPVVGKRLRGSQMLVYDSELDEVDYTDPDDLPEVRDYLPIRFRRYGRLGIGGGILYALCVISISIILACFGWMCAVDVLALNKEPATAVVEITPYEPTGDMPVTVQRENSDGEMEDVEIKVDIDQVADALKNGGIIEYKWLFKIFAGISHANIKMDPGTYSLSTSLDYRALVTKMQFGSDSQETVKVTFPEGFSMDQIFTLLEQSFVCRKDDLYEAAANYDFDYDFLKEIPLGDAQRLEGFLFPDTYEFYQGESAETAISRFLDNTKRKLTDEIRNGFSEHGLTLRQGVIMASLIEKEAGSAEGERENMASVIYNRLGAGWNLQLDSTINYIKDTSTFELTYDDLEIDSPYNTYLYPGLPVGPICNPGAASLQAAADPSYTDYWYWYSVDGVSSFFTNEADFNAFRAAHPY